MASPDIPDERWQPLSVHEVVRLFDGAPFKWCIAGGYAIELFLGAAHRPHSDTDITLFRDDQVAMQTWLRSRGWKLFAADPPGTLRHWDDGEYLPVGIHDIWGHEAHNDAWQLQIMLTEVDGDRWYSRRSRAIGGPRDSLMTIYQGMPCIRVEVQFCYKARGQRPKDEQDFRVCLPHFSAEERSWLRQALEHLYPDGHDWLPLLREG